MRRALPTLFLALTIAVLTAPDSPLRAAGADGPTLTITSPRNELTTMASRIDVTVAAGAGHEPADALVLAINGTEAERIAVDRLDDVEHTFPVDLATYSDGVLTLRAYAVRTVPHPQDRPGQPRPPKTIVVSSSKPVRVQLDRDMSNGVEVGPAGGELTSLDGALSLSIPEGALSGARQITVSKVDPASLPALPGDTTPLVAYELLPHGLQFDKPVSVALTTDDSANQPDGSGSHETVSLLNISGGGVEELANQSLLIDGNSGITLSRGALSHFSNLVRIFNRHYLLTVSGIPEPAVVPVNAMFTVKVRVTPLPSAPLEGGVRFARYDLASLFGPAPDALRLVAPAEPLSLDYVGHQPVEAEFQFQCTQPGSGEELIEVRLVPDTSAYVSVRVFCADAASFEGKRSFDVQGVSLSVSVDPVTQTRIVRDLIRPEIKLVESVGLADVTLNLEIDDLNPEVLSDPRLHRSSHPVRDELDDEGELRTSLGLGSGEQIIVWDCRRAGTTTLVFRFTFSRGPGERAFTEMYAVVECENASTPSPTPTPVNRPPRITNRQVDESPIPPGAPRSYVTLAEDPDGNPLLWDLDVEPVHPQGITIERESGQITVAAGTPAGTYQMRWSVSDGHAEDVLEFTVTVLPGTPVPNTTIVPSVTFRPFSEVPAVFAAAYVVLGTVGTIVDPMLPPETVVSQSPPANTIVPVNTPVDVIISALQGGSTGVNGNEFVINTDTFNLPPGNRVTIAGSNGFVVVDAITGEIPSAGSTELSFVNQGMGPFYGALVLQDPQGTGGDTIFAFGPSGPATTIFDTVADQIGAWSVTARPFLITDAMYFGGDPGAPGALWVSPTLREIHSLAPIDFGAFRVFTWLRPLADRDAFVAAPAGPVSAFAWDLQFNSDASLSTTSTGRVLTVTDGSPGRMYVIDPSTPSTPGIDLGVAGNSPRQLRCVPALQVCAVSNFDSDSITIARWDGHATGSIVGTVPVGDGPVGIDIVADGPNAKVISTGFNDNTYTVTRLTAEGAVLSNDTQAAPSDCVNPGHAAWLRNTPTRAVLSCNTSNSFAVVTP